MVICLRLPQYLASIWAVVWETAETLWSVFEPHLQNHNNTRLNHHFQNEHDLTSEKVSAPGQHSGKQIEMIWDRTYDTLGERCALERGQTQVSNLDRSCWTCDKNVVALQVPVDDGGSPSMKEVETLEDLSTPAPEHFNFHHLEPLQISAREHCFHLLWA